MAAPAFVFSSSSLAPGVMRWRFICLFPLNNLSLVPAAERPSLFFFRDVLLTVCAPAVAPGVLAQISKSEESLCDDLSAVNPDFLELGQRSW